MANKKIENSTLFDKNVVKPTIEEFQELLKVVSLTKDAFKDLLEQSVKQAKAKPFDGYANLKDIQKGIEGIDKATEGLTKAEEEKIKLTQKLADLQTQEAKDNEVIKQQIVATRKELRETAKVRAGLLSLYQKESKELNENRNRYKELFLQTEQNRKGFKGLIFGFTKSGKELKKLRKEVNNADDKLKDLDKAVGQNQRSVGEYEKAWKSLKQQIKTFATIGFVFKILEGLSSAFQANSRTGAELEKLMGRFTVTLSVFISRFADAIPTIKLLFTDFVNGFKRSLLEIQLSIAKTPLIGDDDRAKEIQKELDSLAKDSGKSLSDLGKAFKGIGKEIEKTIQANDRLIDTTLIYKRQINDLIKDQSKLLKSEAELEIQSEDNTLSLQERKIATEELIAVQTELNQIEEEIATKELKLAELGVQASKDSVDAQERLAQATLNLETIRAQGVTERENGLKKLRDIESDDIERRLDFLIDLADKQKAVNDAIIADDTSTFNERQKARIDNQKIESDLFKRANIELNKATKEEIDLNKLKVESDNLVIEEKSKNAGLNDRLVGRILELIRDDIDFTREQTQGKKDLNEAERQSNLTKEESILIEEALNEANKDGANLEQILIDLSDKRLQAEIDNLNIKIALLKNGSEAEIEAQKELDEKLLEQKERQADRESEVEAKKQERLQELRQLGVDSIRNIAQKNLEATTNAIDREISALEAREDSLRELANKGVENVENNLALEQKRRAELEAKRAEAVKRQQRVELGLSVLETYSNKVGSGDPNALTSTITDTSLLLSFINSLPAFYEGTEDTGKVSNGIDHNGGRLSILHDNERVLTAKQNAMIPDRMSNLELATMAQMSDKAVMPSKGIDNPQILNELRELRNAIEAKPVYDFRYDDVKKAVVDVVESRGRVERNFRKNERFF